MSQSPQPAEAASSRKMRKIPRFGGNTQHLAALLGLDVALFVGLLTQGSSLAAASTGLHALSIAIPCLAGSYVLARTGWAAHSLKRFTALVATGYVFSVIWIFSVLNVHSRTAAVLFVVVVCIVFALVLKVGKEAQPRR